MQKQLLCLLLALCLLMTLCVGCGASAVQSAADSGETAQESAASTKDTEDTTEETDVETPDTQEDEPDSDIVEETVETGTYGYPQVPYELPLTDEPIAYTLFTTVPAALAGTMQSAEENFVYQELERRTGIHLDITSVSASSYTDQFMLMIAGGDWTDLLVQVYSAYTGGISAAMNEDIIVDLSEYAEYMPNYNALIESDPNLYRDVTLGDGEIGAVYSLYDRVLPVDSGMMIRGDWLDDLGLEMPDTIDEYYDTIKAFNNEYGAYMYLPKSGLYAHQAVLSAYGVAAYFVDAGFFAGLECFYHEGDTVKCGFLEPGFKDYLQFLSKLYSEGLIDPDYMSTTVALEYLGADSDALSDLLNDKIGIWSDHINDLVLYDSTNAVDPDFRVDPAPLPVLEEGDPIMCGGYMSKLDTPYYSVSTTCEDVELLCQWLDYSFTDEGIELCNWGIEGDTFEKNSDGSYSYTDKIMNNPDYNVETAKGMFLGLGARLRSVDASMASYSDLQKACMELWTENFTGERSLSTQLSMTTEEGARYGELVGDIITYLYECTAKFIVGDLNFEGDYDEFLDNLHTMNIDELVEIEQAMYDRWCAGE